MLTLIGASPAAAAASIPASTFSTGNSTSFIARNVASSSESRLTVTRLKPGIAQAARLFREQRAVGGEREIDVRELCQHFDEALDVAPEERLAAGEPELRYAVAHENARDASDFLEREEIGARQEFVVGAVDLLRHAVDASEIAAVGDRDAQIAQSAGPACPRRRPAAHRRWRRRARSGPARRDATRGHRQPG
jgi:hypothetical protein